MRRHRQQPRGFLAADAIIAMAVLVILASALAVAVSRQRNATARLTNSRAAIRLAERTLTALQSGQPAPSSPGDVVEVIPLDTTSPSATRWVKVRATCVGRSGEVSGLVRAEAAK